MNRTSSKILHGLLLATSGLVGSTVIASTAAMAGGGVGILTPIFWRSAIARGRLVPLFPDHMLVLNRAYWLVYHESMRGIPRIHTVADFIALRVEQDRQLFT